MAKANASKGSTARSIGSKGPSAIVTGYLVVYNVLSTVAWGYVLYCLSCELLESNFKWGLAYVRCGQLVTWVQTAALLEILHAALGLVKSSPVTTAIQVCSRLLILWGVLYSFDTSLTRSHWAFSSMVIAWSFAELVRYPYYAANLFDSQPSWLLWCRYNFFFVLYPIGATSEWILLVRSLGTVYYYSLALYYLYAVIAAVYPIGLYVMYTHMMSQRRKYMRSVSSKSKTG